MQKYQLQHMTEELDLRDIRKGYVGLTKVSGAHLLEGCAITLYRNRHEDGLLIQLYGDYTKTYIIKWPEGIITERLDRCWKDQVYATEQAAVCIGLLLALRLTGMEVIERSVRSTGCDYWIGSRDHLLFQKKARLEISGIFRGNENKMEHRFLQKCRQTGKSDKSLLKVYISVTEFGKPTSKFGAK